MRLSIRPAPVGDTTLVIVLTAEPGLTTRPILTTFLDPTAVPDTSASTDHCLAVLPHDHGSHGAARSFVIL